MSLKNIWGGIDGLLSGRNVSKGAIGLDTMKPLLISHIVPIDRRLGSLAIGPLFDY